MITSATHANSSHDVPLPVEKSGLPKPSLIRASKIASLEPHRVVRRLKILDAETLARVRKKLIETLN
jgi:mRNA-degrading endonuclease toxin of MazEF toxin-antitoxin module